MEYTRIVKFEYRSLLSSNISVSLWFEGRSVLAQVHIARADGRVFNRRGWARCTQEDRYISYYGAALALRSALDGFAEMSKMELQRVLQEVWRQIQIAGARFEEEDKDTQLLVKKIMASE